MNRFSLQSENPKVVLCGGGTGGHVFPNIAISEILKKEGCELFYLGVNGKAEEKLCEKENIDFYGYDFCGFPRKLQKELLIWPFNLLAAISKAKLYLKHFSPDIVFGTGGYSSAPVFIAAKKLNIPYIVHNLDVRFGLANKFCASSASLLTLGFESDEVRSQKVEYKITGNPIRKSFFEIQKKNKSDLYKDFGFDPKKKTIFVAGGSQGAAAINENILEILKDLVLDNNIQVIHQTGELSHEAFTKRIPAKVLETTSYTAKPFIDNPESCYYIADLVVSRSGAMTTTEITCMGKPAIFIPFPFAGNHQEANIMHLVKAGGSILIKQKEVKPKKLFDTIINLLNDPIRLNKMSEVTKSFSNPDATEEIAKLILSRVQKHNNSTEKIKV